MIDDIKIAKELVEISKELVAFHATDEINNGRIASESSKIRNIILDFDESNLKSDAEESRALASANVFHHMRGEKKYVGVNSIDGKKISGHVYDEYRCALGLTSSDGKRVKEAEKLLSSGIFTSTEIQEIHQMEQKIRSEIENCVLISSEFHNWLTTHMDASSESLTFRGRTYPLHTREDYYKLFHRFAGDKTCINKVTKCSFNDTCLIEAIQSICRLKGCINDHLNINSDDLIKKIQEPI